ncbi:cyclin-dependent kinase inhibitor 1-like [Chenopodium quinoa]|nr:cyclin-dependent kinase inhibitor 1-like [Chenopodium quinoa]
MGRYLGKCKGVVGEIAVVGVRTRARAALAMAAATANTTSSPAKKIKKVSKSSYNIPQLRNRRKNLSAPEKTTSSEVAAVVDEEEVANCSSSEVITTARSDFPPSCCSSNYDQLSSSEAEEVVKDHDCLGNSTADPEVESAAETSSKQKEEECHRTELREATKSDGQDSQATKSTAQIRMPSDSEIEEFFAAAEKDIQKRFSDKYNFDIAKDLPLKGRYDWVQIKP